MAHRTRKKNPRNIIGLTCLVCIASGGGGHRCANILSHVTSVYVTKKFKTVRCATPIFKPIAYKLSCTNRKRKYFEEKTTATLKVEQTSIATVRNHLRTLSSFSTPLIFHWSLPLTMQNQRRLFIFFTSRRHSETRDPDPHYEMKQIGNPEETTL